MKLPIIWTHEKQSHEEAEPGRNSNVEKVRREKIRDGESQKSEDAGARKGRKVESTPFSDHFWKLRCHKSARHCGAKHIWK